MSYISNWKKYWLKKYINYTENLEKEFSKRNLEIEKKMDKME